MLEAPTKRVSLEAWLLLAYSLIFWLGVASLAAFKPFWSDELFTYHLAELPTAAQLWSAFAEGAEPTPPVTYFLTRSIHGLLGPGHVTTRLPALAGFWVMTLCVYIFVRRRCSAACAWFALLVPFLTEGFRYAYEARAYGIVLGLCGVALVSWQHAASAAGGRRATLTALALSLALAAATHYYAIFLVGPFLLGELVRACRERRVDWPMLLALAAPLLMLIALLPLIRQAMAYAPTFCNKPQWSYAVRAYPALLKPALVPLTALLAGLLAYRWHSSKGAGAEPSSAWLPLHEVAVTAGILALPVIAVVVAMITVGVYSHRYVLPVSVGFSVGLGLLAGCVWQGPRLLYCLVAITALAAGVRIAREAQRFQERQAWQNEVLALLLQFRDDPRPIALSNPLQALELQHYAPPDLARRLVYLSDPQLWLSRLQQDTPDLSLRRLAEYVPIGWSPREQFEAAHARFLVYETDGWLMPHLREQGSRVRTEASHSTGTVYSVRRASAVSAVPASRIR
jgi:hypothetical protein